MVDLDAGLFSEITVCGVSCFGLLRCLGCVVYFCVVSCGLIVYGRVVARFRLVVCDLVLFSVLLIVLLC